MSEGIKDQSLVIRDFTIFNKRGLHARASAKFVQTVDSFEAEVEVEKDGVAVGGNSIMGLMMLAASPGCCITVRARGKQAMDVIAALGELINSRFGEES